MAVISFATFLYPLTLVFSTCSSLFLCLFLVFLADPAVGLPAHPKAGEHLLTEGGLELMQQLDFLTTLHLHAGLH